MNIKGVSNLRSSEIFYFIFIFIAVLSTFMFSYHVCAVPTEAKEDIRSPVRFRWMWVPYEC